MRLIKLICLFLITTLTFVIATAQNVNVFQKIYVSDNDTYVSALEKALKAAKSEALVKAGVTEYISEYTSLLTTEVNENINEVFNSDLLIHMGGTIKEWEYTYGPEKKFDSQKKLFFIEFEIKAKVKKYQSKPDPTFKAKIDGLKRSYSDGERIEFSIFTFKDSYLNIFYISDSEASIIFPYELAQETFIKAKNEKIIDYLVAESNSNYESGRLIIVITKRYYPFDSSLLSSDGYYTISTADDIFKWLLDIEPENRTEYFQLFAITK